MPPLGCGERWGLPLAAPPAWPLLAPRGLAGVPPTLECPPPPPREAVLGGAFLDLLLVFVP